MATMEMAREQPARHDEGSLDRQAGPATQSTTSAATRATPAAEGPFAATAGQQQQQQQQQQQAELLQLPSAPTHEPASSPSSSLPSAAVAGSSSASASPSSSSPATLSPIARGQAGSSTAATSPSRLHPSGMAVTATTAATTAATRMGNRGEKDDESEEMEEMEEVLEELNDDDDGAELAGIRTGSRLGHADVLTGGAEQEASMAETMATMQGASVAALQTLLRSIGSDPGAVALIGGQARLDALEAAVAAVAQSLKSTSPISSTSSQGPASALSENSAAQEAAASLNHLLDSFSLDAAQRDASLADDLNLINALGSLLSSLEASKAHVSTDLVLGSESAAAALPRSSSPQTAPAALGSLQYHQQQSYAQRFGHRAPTGATRMPSSPLAQTARASVKSPSPSASRESLRDPFAETEGIAMAPTAIAVEDGSMAFAKLLDSLIARSSSCIDAASLVATSSSRAAEVNGSNSSGALLTPPSSTTSTAQAHTSPAKTLQRQAEERQDALAQLQRVAAIARDLVASRSATAPQLLSAEQCQPFSGLLGSRTSSPGPSPQLLAHANSSYSPAMSPTRGRSRRNSMASLNSPSSISPGSEVPMPIGDPAGEALAAGVGVGVGVVAGASRSLSRPSSRSNLRHAASSSAAAGAATMSSPPPPPPLGGPTAVGVVCSPSSRRASSTSEGNASIAAMHSPPPRYSEDSMRNWSSTFGHGHHAAASSLSGVPSFDHAQKDGVLSRSSSSDVSFGTTAHFLPAYARGSDNIAYRYGDDVKGRSSSSLSHYDAKLGSSGGGAFHHSTETIAREKERARSASATQEYLARTSQDLTMVENGIARLYTALPQLSDQRATLNSSPQSHSNFSRAAAEEEKPGAVFDALERLSRSGRMEDQRAFPPPPPTVASSSSLNKLDSPLASPVEPSSPSSGGARGLVRRFSSVAPLALGSLSLRGRGSAAEGKGKRRERDGHESAGYEASLSSPSPVSERHIGNGHSRLDRFLGHRSHDEDADLDRIASRVLSSRDREYADQRVEFRARPKQMGRASKLEKMGMAQTAMASGSEDDLFEKLSSASRRLEGQDAVMRPKNGRRSMDMLTQTHKRGSASLPLSSRDLVRARAAGADGNDADSKWQTQTIGDFSDKTLATQVASGMAGASSAHLEGGGGNDLVGNDGDSDDFYAGQPTSKWVQSHAPSSSSSSSPQGKAANGAGAAPSYRSSGLALQAGKEEAGVEEQERKEDSQECQWRYVCETQARLGTMTISLWREQDVEETHWRFEVDASGERIELTCEDGGGNDRRKILCYPLSSRGTPGQGAMTPKEDHKSAKISVSTAVTDEERPDTFVETPLSASTLESSRTKSLVCTSCLETVVDLQSVSRFVALPSQHWEELIDAWMCHGDQEINVGLIQAHKDMDESKPVQVGEVRVSDSQLTLNGINAVAGKIDVVNTTSSLEVSVGRFARAEGIGTNGLHRKVVILWCAPALAEVVADLVASSS